MSDRTAQDEAMQNAIDEAKRILTELIEHWDEHSDGNKIRTIKDVIEEVL